MAYYIGVDGGGTKTAYALFDENKNLLEMVKTVGSNHENLEGSFDEATEIIMSGIEQLVEKAGISLSDVQGTLMGLAGIDHPFQHDALYERMYQKGLRDFELYNDGFIVTKAGSPTGVGIGYNCGTGTCCNSIDSDGKMLQIGGFGQLSGDLGNGHWIARSVYALAYDEICLRKRKTVVTPMICNHFGVAQDREGLLSLIPRVDAEEEQAVRDLIDIFFEALNAGDESALEVCEEMATRGAEFIAAHTFIQNFKEETIPVVLSGSMHTKLPSGVYVEKMKQYACEKSGRNLQFIILNQAPVTGCINWLLEKRG